MNPEQIWQAAQEELRFQLSKPSYETWLKNASLVGREKNAFKIGVPTKLAKDWLEDRYLAMIKETLSAIVSGDVSVAFEVVPGQAEPASRKTAVAVAEAPVPEEEDPVLPETSQLNPKFQFQHFVVGNNSRFAHAACRAVAETPAKAYNPLFLYGGVGLGKTHLMHAIGHAVLEKHHRKRVAYVTSEKFMNEMISSIQEGPAGRRYPVPGGQGPHPGGVLPHLQLTARTQSTDCDLLRPAAQRDSDAGGTAPVTIQLGADRRHPAGRL